MGRIGERAVVIGASMAGLAAARVAAERFEQVLILDRDELPAGPEHRRGVPQSRHVHGLLPSGGQALELLFPGLTEQLHVAGVRDADYLGNMRWYVGGGRLKPMITGLTVLPVGRPLLERVVRDRVRAIDEVDIVDGCDVLGLLANSDRTRVTGVRVLRRADHSAEETMTADLVIDASGRGSRTPAQLADLGYHEPAVEHVHVGIRYVSRRYRLPEGVLDDDVFVGVAPTPHSSRFGALLLQEDGSWLVSIGGLLDDGPPRQDPGFLEFARTLAVLDIYDVLRVGEPLDDPVPAHFPASIRRRYDRLRRFPAGLVVTGDAIACFNPTYGQGMSVAALQALALGKCLDRHPPEALAGRFFRTAHSIEDVAWQLAVGGDLRHPGVQRPRPVTMRLAAAYLDHLVAVAHHDAHVATAFVRVAGLIDPPTALFRPATVRRVVAGNLRRRASPRTDHASGATTTCSTPTPSP